MTNIPLLEAHVHRWIARHPDEITPQAWSDIHVTFDDYVSAIQRISVIPRKDKVHLLFRGHCTDLTQARIAQQLLTHLRRDHAGLGFIWSGSDQLTLY